MSGAAHRRLHTETMGRPSNTRFARHMRPTMRYWPYIISLRRDNNHLMKEMRYSFYVAHDLLHFLLSEIFISRCYILYEYSADRH